MKKNVLFLFCLTPLLFSCGFEIPSSLNIKTDAKYSLTLGSKEKDLSEYISLDMIKEMVNGKPDEKGKTERNYSIYDYNPGGTATVQSYLMEIPIQEIPIDMSSYFENMDFAADIKGMSFEQEIKTADLSSFGKDDIELCDLDLNSVIIGKANIVLTGDGDACIPIPEMGNLDSIDDASKPKLRIDFDSPEFDYISFYSGRLLFDMNKFSGSYSSGFVSSFVFSLLDGNGNLVSKTDPINVNSPDFSGISFEMAGKKVTGTMEIRVNGTSTGGTPGNIVKYGGNIHFSNDSKIKEVAGITVPESDITPIVINQTISSVVPETLVEAVVSSGSLELISKLPEGMEQIQTKTTVRFSGGLTKDGGPLSFTDNEGNGSVYVLNKTGSSAVDLNGAKILGNSAINIQGEVKYSLENATLKFAEGGVDSKIKAKVAGKVNKVSSMVVKLASTSTKTEFSKPLAEVFPDSVKNYLKEIKLAKAKITGTYVNTLPADESDPAANLITLKVNSGFYGIDNKAVEMKPATENGKVSIEGTATPTVDLDNLSGAMDVTSGVNFPQASGYDGNYIQLKNIDLSSGASYKIGLTLNPEIDWESVTLKSLAENVPALKGNVDTNFSFDSVMSEMGKKTGDSFISALRFKELNMYMYCEKPSLESLNNFKLTGTVKLESYDKDNNLLGTDDALKGGLLSFKNPAELEYADEKKTVVINKKFEDASIGPLNMAWILNTKGNIKIDYDLTLSNGSESGLITINKSEMDALKQDMSTPTSIKLFARLEMPLSFVVNDGDADQGESIVIDMNKMMDKVSDSGERLDLMDRDKASDIEDFRKYIKAIDYVEVGYAAKNEVFNIEPNVPGKKLECSIDFSGMKNGKGETLMFNTTTPTLGLENNVLNSWKITKHDAEALLDAYPLNPAMKVAIPEGKFSIPRNAKIGVKLMVTVKADGNTGINIFGGDDEKK